jgi:hypothetical protein
VGNAAIGKAYTVDLGNGRKTYWLENRYPDALWARIEAARKKSLHRKIKARGLSKQSWWLLAARAGLQINAPGFVKKAVASTTLTYPENFTARQVNRRDEVGIFFSNAQPTVPWAGGQRALRKAINGRVGFFRRNLKLGVFKDMKKIAVAYPGLRIS